MTTLVDKIAPYAVQFRRDGFVMVPELLRADELERYGAAVDEAVARHKHASTIANSARRLPTNNRSSNASTCGKTHRRSGR